MWLRECQDAATLTDDKNVEGQPNLHGFVDYRHDQAVLTNIFSREKWAALPHGLFRVEHDRNRT